MVSNTLGSIKSGAVAVQGGNWVGCCKQALNDRDQVRARSNKFVDMPWLDTADRYLRDRWRQVPAKQMQRGGLGVGLGLRWEERSERDIAGAVRDGL